MRINGVGVGVGDRGKNRTGISLNKIKNLK